MNDLLANVRAAFAGTPRPEHFTDYQHCDECREHDEVLARHTPDTISLDEVGNPGWDPICFTLDEAFLYYLPGLVRLADAEPLEYMDQLLFHLTYDPSRLASFSKGQRLALLEWLTAKDAEHGWSAGDSPTASLMQLTMQQLLE